MGYASQTFSHVNNIMHAICCSYIASMSRISLLLQDTEGGDRGQSLRSSVNNNDILQVLVI